MRVLIIGGTGLISTAITRTLIARGDDVVLYNRGQTDADIPEGYDTITGNQKDYDAFEAQMTEAGSFEAVIDMIGFVPMDVESAVRAFRGNIGQFIFCSTVDVYTKPAQHYPIREDAARKPMPSFPYAYNKAKCERLLEEAHARGDFPVTIIRPAHTYGEGRGLIHSLGLGGHITSTVSVSESQLSHTATVLRSGQHAIVTTWDRRSLRLLATRRHSVKATTQQVKNRWRGINTIRQLRKR